MTEKVTLAKMESGTTGEVSKIQGGFGLERNLENMGVRPGTKIKKVNKQFMSGPVIVQVGNTQVAMGHGMAKKVLVEID
ncbi:MAG: FeoA family protein [Elusimicrobiota bacterium]